MSLAARHLEANGIASVIIGSALDIVEHCAVPRYLHVDFPLGNPCGKPWDRRMQLAIVAQALGLFARATRPATTERAPFTWDGNNAWREHYSRVDDSNREELARRGAQRRRRQAADKAGGVTRAAMIAEVDAPANDCNPPVIGG